VFIESGEIPSVVSKSFPCFDARPMALLQLSKAFVRKLVVACLHGIHGAFESYTPQEVFILILDGLGLKRAQTLFDGVPLSQVSPCFRTFELFFCAVLRKVPFEL